LTEELPLLKPPPVLLWGGFGHFAPHSTPQVEVIVSQETEVDFKTLGVYLVEGVAEVDPMTDRAYVSTVDQQGNHIEFDPVPVLRQFKGQEIRVVIVPLASVAQLEELARKVESQGEQVKVVDPPQLSNEPPAPITGSDPTSN